MMSDIEPMRMSAVDIASLSPVECRAILVVLAGSGEAVVTAALVDAVRKILARTRGQEE